MLMTSSDVRVKYYQHKKILRFSFDINPITDVKGTKRTYCYTLWRFGRDIGKQYEKGHRPAQKVENPCVR